ncbi:MAG TPA: hypothetical protein VGD92_00295 [Sphingobacteriaceae bacterium]
MHIEFSAQFEPELREIITRLNLDAHLFNSFNINGETVTLSAEREELEKIVEHPPESFGEGGANAEHYRKIVALVRANLR